MNTIELAKAYAPMLAEAFKKDSLTQILETNSNRALYEGAAADEVKIPILSTDGLGNYSKTNGYPDGSVSLSWETRKLTQDRGRRFNIDTVENMESLGLVVSRLLSDFQRSKVVPEVDAYRFSKIALGSATGNRANASITTGANLEKAVNEAGVVLDNEEVPRENRVLFLTPAMLNLLKSQISRFVLNDENNIKREVLTYDGMAVVAVPENRFYSGITISANGFSNSGVMLNFMVVHKDSVIPVVKHNPIRLFSPEENQDADAYLLVYRLYHDLFIQPNKQNGIYVHSTTAISTTSTTTP